MNSTKYGLANMMNLKFMPIIKCKLKKITFNIWLVLPRGRTEPDCLKISHPTFYKELNELKILWFKRSNLNFLKENEGG